MPENYKADSFELCEAIHPEFLSLFLLCVNSEHVCHSNWNAGAKKIAQC